MYFTTVTGLLQNAAEAAGKEPKADLYRAKYIYLQRSLQMAAGRVTHSIDTRHEDLFRFLKLQDRGLVTDAGALVIDGNTIAVGGFSEKLTDMTTYDPFNVDFARLMFCQYLKDNGAVDLGYEVVPFAHMTNFIKRYPEI